MFIPVAYKERQEINYQTAPIASNLYRTSSITSTLLYSRGHTYVQPEFCDKKVC